MSTETLKYNDHLFRALIEHSADAIALMQVDGTIVYASPSTLYITGYQAEEFVGMNGLALLHPDDLPGIQSKLSSLVEQPGAFIHFEYRLLHKNGTYRWMEGTATNLLDDPAISAIVGNYHDITERKEREQELQQIQQRQQEEARRGQAQARELETILETITDGIFVYDTAGHLLRTNAAARALNPSTTQPDYLARSFQERIKAFTPRVEYSDASSFDTTAVQRVLQGEVFTGKDALDSIMRGPDGSHIELNVSGAPLRDGQGQIYGGLIVTRDVTRRRMLEREQIARANQLAEALQTLLVFAETLVRLPLHITPLEAASQPSEATSESVIHRLAELICRLLGCKRASITTIDQVSGQVQASAVVGITREQEQAWRTRQSGFTLQELISQMPTTQQQLAAGEAVTLDLRQPPFADQPNPFGISTMLLAPMILGKRLIGVLALDQGGEAHNYSEHEIALARAVAQLAALTLEQERLLFERAQAQANVLALRETNHLMDEFLGIAGHELRTPLTTIRACVQLARRQLGRVLQQEARLPAELSGLLFSVQNLLERMERQVGMQNRLVSDLLDVSRIQNDHLELHRQPTDLVQLVRDAVEDQQFLTPNRPVGLSLTLTGAIFVNVDSDRIRQVLSNYLSNALKYSEADTPVEVCIERDTAQVRVLVQDEGPGLSAQAQQRIWERFYRVPEIQVKSGSGVGLGLGLHISRIIIERHGGQVGVESARGHGSTFWFTLPIDN